MTLADVARSLNLSPATLRRWVADGIVPLRDGEWTPAAIAQARLRARLRSRRPRPRPLRPAAGAGPPGGEDRPAGLGLPRGPLPGVGERLHAARRRARDRSRAGADPPHLGGR